MKPLFLGNAEQVPFALAGSFSVMLRQMSFDVAMLRLRANLSCLTKKDPAGARRDLFGGSLRTNQAVCSAFAIILSLIYNDILSIISVITE